MMRIGSTNWTMNCTGSTRRKPEEFVARKKMIVGVKRRTVRLMSVIVNASRQMRMRSPNAARRWGSLGKRNSPSRRKSTRKKKHFKKKPATSSSTMMMSIRAMSTNWMYCRRAVRNWKPK